MNRILLSLSFLCLLTAVACKPTPTMESMAMKRLPKALEKAMEEQLSLSGGAQIVSPRTIYACDSLCMVQFEAVARDPSGQEFRFPVRYVLLQDRFMSAATGHPVYAESVAGSPTMDEEEVRELVRYCAEHGHEMYIHYAGIANPIDREDL